MSNNLNNRNGIILKASDFGPIANPLDAYRSLIDYRLVPIQNLTEETMLNLAVRTGIQVNFQLSFGEMNVYIHRKLISEVEEASAYISESTEDEFCTISANNNVFFTGNSHDLIEDLREFDRLITIEPSKKENESRGFKKLGKKEYLASAISNISESTSPTKDEEPLNKMTESNAKKLITKKNDSAKKTILKSHGEVKRKPAFKKDSLMGKF